MKKVQAIELDPEHWSMEAIVEVDVEGWTLIDPDRHCLKGILMLQSPDRKRVVSVRPEDVVS